jgi:hypothetical protein
VNEIDELVGLPTQFVGDHRRLRSDGRDDGHTHALALQRLDQRAEVTIAGK